MCLWAAGRTVGTVWAVTKKSELIAQSLTSITGNLFKIFIGWLFYDMGSLQGIGHFDNIELHEKVIVFCALLVSFCDNNKNFFKK